MAITKSIVDMMGDGVRVETAPGKGSEFIINVTFEIVDKPIKADADTDTEDAEAYCGKAVDYSKAHLLNDRRYSRSGRSGVGHWVRFRALSDYNAASTCVSTSTSLPQSSTEIGFVPVIFFTLTAFFVTVTSSFSPFQRIV